MEVFDSKLFTLVKLMYPIPILFSFCLSVFIDCCVKIVSSASIVNIVNFAITDAFNTSNLMSNINVTPLP